MIAALYVLKDGPYFNVPLALTYGTRSATPAITPDRGRLSLILRAIGGAKWPTLLQAMGRGRIGDDGGCFESALSAVRKFGGVLEHPAQSIAWKHYGLLKPNGASWTRQLFDPGWVCQVDQGNYGHCCNKPTWLYAVGCKVRPLKWGKATGTSHCISRWKKQEGKIQLDNKPSDRRIASSTPELIQARADPIGSQLPKALNETA